MAEALVPQERPALRVSAYAAPGAAGISLISVNIKRVDGKAGVFNCMLYLSDSAVGAGFTAVTATGATVAGTAGVIIGTDLVAKKAWNIQTDATGLFILSVTDTAKTPFQVIVEIEGRSYPVLLMATASYG